LKRTILDETIFAMKRIDDQSLSLEDAGRKAYSLKELTRAGFRVPPGFVVAPDEPVNQDELSVAIAAIGGYPVAIRSSANLEDLEGASFAGQYQTFLEVASLEEAIARISDCRESANAPQIRSYLSSRGLGHLVPKVTVLVQKMVDGRWAGVAFSIHPITGKEEHGLIEYCEGLGERLVSGHITPAQLTVELRTGAIVAKETGDIVHSISEDFIAELSSKMLAIQAHYGSPQDIEWAVGKDGALYILQARPITKIQFRTDIEEFTNADFKDGGVSARVCTPLMYSLYREAMQSSMPEYFRKIGLLNAKSKRENWIAMYYGRPYWNASAVKRVMAKVPGWDERTLDADLGIQKEYGPQGPVRVPTNLKTILPAIPVAIGLEAEFKRCLREAEQFTSEFDEREARLRRETRNLRSMSDGRFFGSLKQILFDFYVTTETTYFNVIYNNANAQSELKSLIRKIDEATGEETSVVSLLGGLSDISHLELQRDILELHRVAKEAGIESAAFERSLHFFLERNYFHGDAELELKTPRWGEDPTRVVSMIQAMIDAGAAPADPEATTRKQRGEYEAEVARVCERISRSFMTTLRFSRSFKKQLERTRAYLSLRESIRERSSKAYALVRLFLLEAARRWVSSGVLAEADQIFMFELGEVATLITKPEMTADLKAMAEYRKSLYEGYAKFTPPNELGRGISAGDATAKAVAGCLTGLGCSPGSVTGRARVIASLDEISQIRPGDVLVTRFTDPGWTPVLGMVKGVVTEVGGMLSHAAVIGREYGIPAVLNVKDATRLIRSGDLIEVDGSLGSVRVVEGASAAVTNQEQDFREEREIEESLAIQAPQGVHFDKAP
jgi:phosphohistidine swiveling domain-containing protein